MDSENAELLLNEDHPDQEHFESVTDEEVGGKSRWSTFYSQVWKDTRDGTFWSISWDRGSTEMQDNGIENVEVQQVWPYETVVVAYRNTPPEVVS